MRVNELIAQLSKLPQDLEVVVWSDNRECYTGFDKPSVVELVENDNGELIDCHPSINGDKVKHISLTLFS